VSSTRQEGTDVIEYTRTSSCTLHLHLVIMRSPRRRGEVNKEWVEYMLTEFENRNSPGCEVTIKTWETSDGSKKGDGCIGDLLKLEVKATVKNNEKSIEKEYHHIIKFTSQDPIEKEFMKTFGNATREFLMYSEILEKLNDFQANLTNNKFPICIPTYVFGRHNDKEHVLVMENMNNVGYENKSKFELLNINEAKMALEQLARLHAISYVYDKTCNIKENYPGFDAQHFLNMSTSNLDLKIDMAVEFLKFQGEHKELINKILSSKTQIIEKAKRAFIKRDKPQIFCINHGDPWNNNILIRKANVSKSDIGVCLIDWEDVHWNTSAYDLHYFLAGAVTPELRVKHMDELLQFYHDHFTEVTNKLGSPIPNWNYNIFRDEYDAVSFWGLLESFGFCMEISEASKDWEAVNHDPTTNPVLKSIKQVYGKILVSMFIKPSLMDMFIKQDFKKWVEPLSKEMKSGKNPGLNERYLSNILEGDIRG
ncbi:unnamed protein product, partial [Meganyctiphanes norvegica]